MCRAIPSSGGKEGSGRPGWHRGRMCRAIPSRSGKEGSGWPGWHRGRMCRAIPSSRGKEGSGWPGWHRGRNPARQLRPQSSPVEGPKRGKAVGGSGFGRRTSATHSSAMWSSRPVWPKSRPPGRCLSRNWPNSGSVSSVRLRNFGLLSSSLNCADL
eukprot:357646-Chlamydomonas_euryale.AAC.2